MSQNLFVYAADSVVAILIPVSRAGTGRGVMALPIPVPGSKLLHTTESAA